MITLLKTFMFSLYKIFFFCFSNIQYNIFIGFILINTATFPLPNHSEIKPKLCNKNCTRRILRVILYVRLRNLKKMLPCLERQKQHSKTYKKQSKFVTVKRKWFVSTILFSKTFFRLQSQYTYTVPYKHTHTHTHIFYCNCSFLLSHGTPSSPERRRPSCPHRPRARAAAATP